MAIVVKVPGVEIALSGQKYVMAPLTAGPLKQILERVRDLEAGKLEAVEMVDLAVDIALHSLRRNYPDITREAVENDLVDMQNFNDVIRIGMSASALAPRDEALGKSQPGPKAKAKPKARR